MPPEQDLLLPSLLLEAIGEAVIALDANHMVVLWNAAAEAVYGWSKAEAVGQAVTGLLRTSFEDPNMTRELALAAVQRDGAWQGVVRQVRKDGAEVIVETTVRSYTDPASGLSGLVAVNRDVSERERLRAGLGRLEYLNRILLRQPTQDEIFDTYVNQIREVISADQIELWLLDPPSGLVTAARRYTRQAAEVLPGAACPLKETPLGLVSLTREPLVVPDLSERVHFTQRALLPPGARSLMLLPLMRQFKVAGAIVFVGRGSGQFSPQDASLLTSTTEQFSLALMQIELVDALKHQAQENARLFHEAQETAQALEALSRKLIRMQERERAQLSREFHDEIGQALTAVFLNTRSVLTACQGQPPEVVSAMQESMEILSRLMEQVRSISLELHPKILEDLGFIPALRWLANRTARLSRAEVHFGPLPDYTPLPRETEFELFRIAQEALTNVLRHANASRIFLHLTQDDASTTLVIADNGRGFAADYRGGAQLPAHFFGVHSMFARAALIGASLHLSSQPGNGCTLKVRCPRG